MRSRYKRFIGVAFMLLTCCIEPYNLNEEVGNGNFLVIDGFLDATTQSVQVKLSYTVPLGTEGPLPVENLATVLITNDKGNEFQLNNVGGGMYVLAGLDVDLESLYQLRITVNGEVFESNFVPVSKTPAIESLSWSAEEDGIDIHISTGTEQESSKYFIWSFEETWEYFSAFTSLVKLENGQIIDREADEYIRQCWKTVPSTEIAIASSVQYNDNLLRNYPIKHIALGSPKLFTAYSILVKQRSLDRSAYEYWLELQQTTQELGGLFDALPSRITGNIQSVSNRAKPVLGYFSAGQTKEMRISIKATDLPDSHRFFSYSNCELLQASVPEGPKLPNAYLLVAPIYALGGIGDALIGYTYASSYCVDCRLQGGTTTKPGYWPN